MINYDTDGNSRHAENKRKSTAIDKGKIINSTGDRSVCLNFAHSRTKHNSPDEPSSLISGRVLIAVTCNHAETCNHGDCLNCDFWLSLRESTSSILSLMIFSDSGARRKLERRGPQRTFVGSKQ